MNSSEEKFQTRQQIKRDTSANWALATNFTPLEGELIYYLDLNRLKIGDGDTKVNALPFLDISEMSDYIKQSENLSTSTLPILFSSDSSPTSTNYYQVNYSTNISVQPSTGTIKSTKMEVGAICTLQVDATLNTLNFVFT